MFREISEIRSWYNCSNLKGIIDTIGMVTLVVLTTEIYRVLSIIGTLSPCFILNRFVTQIQMRL